MLTLLVAEVFASDVQVRRSLVGHTCVVYDPLVNGHVLAHCVVVCRR